MHNAERARPAGAVGRSSHRCVAARNARRPRPSQRRSPGTDRIAGRIRASGVGQVPRRPPTMSARKPGERRQRGHSIASRARPADRRSCRGGQGGAAQARAGATSDVPTPPDAGLAARAWPSGPSRTTPAWSMTLRSIANDPRRRPRERIRAASDAPAMRASRVGVAPHGHLPPREPANPDRARSVETQDRSQRGGDMRRAILDQIRKLAAQVPRPGPSLSVDPVSQLLLRTYYDSSRLRAR